MPPRSRLTAACATLLALPAAPAASAQAGAITTAQVAVGDLTCAWPGRTTARS